MLLFERLAACGSSSALKRLKKLVGNSDNTGGIRSLDKVKLRAILDENSVSHMSHNLPYIPFKDCFI